MLFVELITPLNPPCGLATVDDVGTSVRTNGSPEGGQGREICAGDEQPNQRQGYHTNAGC